MPNKKRADNTIRITSPLILTLLTLFAAGCGDPDYAVWFNPEKTLEEAEKDMADCYFDAFLAQRQNPQPEEFSHVEKDPKEDIEAAARKCMKKAGYRRRDPDKLDPAIRIKSGTAHTMDYSIAGK